VAFLERIRQDQDIRNAAVMWFVYATILVIVSIRSHFAILANDTFPLLFQAEHLSTADPQSFYNGFFPIGYPLTLKALLLFGRQHIDVTGVLLNLALSFGLIYCLIKLLATADLKGLWLILAVTITIFLPEMVRGVLTLRPDFIVAVLATGAFLCYRCNRFDLAGLLLGSACLFRTHALALVIAIVIVTFIFHGWRDVLKCLLFAIPFVALQGLINLYAGESLFASAQGFNIAKMVHGADWRQEQLQSPNALDIILQHPAAFLHAYVSHLLTEWYILIPLIAGIAIRSTRELAFIALLDFLAVGLGGSPRGSLPIQPVAVFCVVGAMLYFLRNSKLLSSRATPITGIILIATAVSVMLYKSATVAGSRVDRYEHLAAKLELQSEDDAKRVLSDDFAMYFPQLANATPHVNGGWGPIGIPVYREHVPQFMYAEPTVLFDSLIAHSIQRVVLRQPSTDPRLQSAVSQSPAHFERREDISGYAVYKVR
jgi:hypothetical protein